MARMAEETHQTQIMKPEQIRIKVAEACGWKWYYFAFNACEGGFYQILLPADWIAMKNGVPVDTRPDGWEEEAANVPNFPEDLNAIQEAWSTLGWEEKNECVEHLKDIVKEADCEAYFATAAQRCEAFLSVKGLFQEL